MNVSADLVLAWLEEDNAQRVYFRILPLLTVDGDAREEARKLWPDEGGLRIVPDRNEQHTFKERMRALGHYCVMDLRPFPPESGKIRTNKNYRPDRGEVNQYIVYSDAVKELPAHTFYEVLQAAPGEAAAAAARAVTPRFFLQDGDTFYGPVDRSRPEDVQTAEAMSAPLYSVACPDGVTRQILCLLPEAPARAAEPAPEAAAKPAESEEALPIGQELHILDESRSFEETIEQLDQPLSHKANLLRTARPAPAPVKRPPQTNDALNGTPLFRQPMRSASMPPRNRTQEAVARESRVARNIPPAEDLPDRVTLRCSDNPLEEALRVFKEAWSIPEARPQLVRRLIALDGMARELEQLHTGELCSASPLQTAMQEHLNDLEMERLTLLVQLRQAKRHAAAYREEVIADLPAKRKKEAASFREECTAHQRAIDRLKQEINSMVDELHSGRKTDPDTICQYFNRETQGDNLSAALTALLAACPRAGFVAEDAESGKACLKRLLHDLWVDTPDTLPAGEMPEAVPAVFFSGPEDAKEVLPLRRWMISSAEEAHTGTVAWAEHPWPILPIGSDEPSIGMAPHSLSLASLEALTESTGYTRGQVSSILEPLEACCAPMGDDARREMIDFVRAATGLMAGGLPSACDWAIAMWLLPRVQDRALLRKRLLEYPLSSSRI